MSDTKESITNGLVDAIESNEDFQGFIGMSAPQIGMFRIDFENQSWIIRVEELVKGDK